MENIRIIRSQRKSIAIVVLSTGIVEVRAPKYVPQFVIKAFVNSKKDWIKERQEHVAKNILSSKKFVNGERIMFLGEAYSLLLGNYIHIEVKDGYLLFPLALATRGKEVLEKWYIKQARLVIREQVEYYSKEMGLSYNGISFSDTSSKWEHVHMITGFNLTGDLSWHLFSLSDTL